MACKTCSKKQNEKLNKTNGDNTLNNFTKFTNFYFMIIVTLLMIIFIPIFIIVSAIEVISSTFFKKSINLEKVLFKVYDSFDNKKIDKREVNTKGYDKEKEIEEIDPDTDYIKMEEIDIETKQ